MKMVNSVVSLGRQGGRAFFSVSPAPCARSSLTCAERSAALAYQTLIGVTHYDAAEEEMLLREQLLHRPAVVRGST